MSDVVAIYADNQRINDEQQGRSLVGTPILCVLSHNYPINREEKGERHLNDD